MLNLIILRQTCLNWVVVCIGATLLAGCVGEPVESYKTKTQKFSWGEMYVWMSTAQGTTNIADIEGSGYLLLNFSFKKNVMKKGCALTVQRVYLKDADTGVVLIDDITSLANETLMTEEIGEYDSGQLSLSKYPFKYVQSSFPYNLSLDMDFNCNNKKTPLTFSKQIEFSMVQPVLWEQ
jgi:hypothetical protein